MVQRKGFTLIEVLVAMTILVLVMVAAYSVYNRSQKLYLLGQSMSDTQQNTRIAFQKLLAELRAAGWNWNPTGYPDFPDEQIEGIWERAIVFRGDFDKERENSTFESDTCKQIENPSLPFYTTTGNDEIIGYVLVSESENASANQDSITFSLDLVGQSDVKRDAYVDASGNLVNQETVTINGIDLTGNFPPYTLYRFTFKPGQDGSCGAIPPGTTSITASIDAQEYVIFTPVAYNIRDLRFVYYDSTGEVQDPANWNISVDPSNPDYKSILGAETSEARMIRSGSAASGGNVLDHIKVDLVGMVDKPDVYYKDPLDTLPESSQYRKFRLSSTVELTNLGQRPHRVGEEASIVPDPPSNLQAHPGHCEGMLLTWSPSPTEPDISAYEIQWKLTTDSDYPSSNRLITYNAQGSLRWGYVSNLTNGETYQFRVFSISTTSDYSNTAAELGTPVTVIPDTTHKPEAPPTVTATVLNPGEVEINWNQKVNDDLANNYIVENDVIAQATEVYPSRDLKGYRVYRKFFQDGNVADFDPFNDPGSVLISFPEENPPSNPYLVYTGPNDTMMTDKTFCPCESYGYKVVAENRCYDPGQPEGNNLENLSFPSTLMAVTLTDKPSGAKPAPGSNLNLVNASIDPTDPTLYTLTFEWDRVIQAIDAGNNVVGNYRTAKYELRASDTPGSYDVAWRDFITDPDPALGGVDPRNTKVTATVTLTIPSGEYRYFKVNPYWECGTAKTYGGWSNEVKVPCDATWDIQFNSPTDGSSVSGLVPVEIEIINLPADTNITKVNLTVPPPSQIIPESPTGGPTIFTTSWYTYFLPNGQATLTALVIDSKGCQKSKSITVWVNNNCPVQIFENGIDPGDPNTILFKIQAPNDGSNYFVDYFTFTASSNYILTELSAQDAIGSYILDNTPQSLVAPTTFDLFQQSNYPDLNYVSLNETAPDGIPRTIWFRATFDKPINGDNGPLNLVLEELGIQTNTTQCTGTTLSHQFKKAKKTTTLTPNPLCRLSLVVQDWCDTSQDPNYSVDWDTGYMIWNGPWGLGNKCDVTLYYEYQDTVWGSLQTCAAIPLFIGP